ncbi:cellulose synthase operon protein C [Klebsiella pneumoniae]|uniref:Cellulose synthase operon protein C n=1 Tax=Klebsiella pneumoniae TaxID=573 RepID=A0A377XGC4_KLEPN|nr:cellulose synthase operon protein C [Klebsiella pneumoniae]
MDSVTPPERWWSGGVTSNWFVGAAVDIQQAKDYTPSHALLYVRYSAAGWQGDLDMPPQPLVPYADW